MQDIPKKKKKHNQSFEKMVSNDPFSQAGYLLNQNGINMIDRSTDELAYSLYTNVPDVKVGLHGVWFPTDPDYNYLVLATIRGDEDEFDPDYNEGVINNKNYQAVCSSISNAQPSQVAFDPNALDATTHGCDPSYYVPDPTEPEFGPKPYDLSIVSHPLALLSLMYRGLKKMK